MALPKPVWTDDDITVAQEVARNPSSLIWNSWNESPTKIAVLRAIVSCQVRLGHAGDFGLDMTYALAQKWVCFPHPSSLEGRGSALLSSFQRGYWSKDFFMSLSKHPDWRSPVSIVPEESHEAS